MSVATVWETRAWAITPNYEVTRAVANGRLLDRRVWVLLDPRAFETEDLNELAVEGTVRAVSNLGPRLHLGDPEFEVALIDVLLILPYDPPEDATVHELRNRVQDH